MTTEETPERRENGNDRRVSDRRAATESKSKSGSGIWVVLSFALTAIIIAWGFSLPFRKHDRPLLVWDESDVPRVDDTVRKVRLTKEEANAYRAAALQRDRAFLRERRDRLRQRAMVPGAAEAKEASRRRAESMKKKVHELRDAPRDSLQGKYRQELIEKLEAPQ